MCDNATMEYAEKTYGFYLLKIPSKTYKSGFYYAVKYKDFDTGKWLRTKTSTNTDNETVAKAFAIENREAIINKYKIHAEILHKKNDGKEFYKMLKEYYTPLSDYLKDDYVNGKKIIDKKQRDLNISFITNYLIPYFKENKINSVPEITRTVYSNLKLYLQNVKNKKGNKITTKSINNKMISFIRILQYHERHEIILKMPFTKGGGLIKVSQEEKKNRKKPNPLPTKYLKGIFKITINKKDGRENSLLYYTLSLIGLTTGMRDSEIGRIKVSDIIYVMNDGYFYVKAYNHKTEYYNVEETDEYRKIPLHPFVVKKIKYYIKEKNIGKNDYLFGIPKMNEDTNQIDGHLHFSKTHKAIMFLYKQIKIKEDLELPSIEELEKELNKKRIVFYSLRHTFHTLCGLYTKNDNGLIRNADLIDYFTGHNSGSSMRSNYTHINSVDDHTFYHNYGIFIINVLDKFIFRSEEENKEIENYAEKFYDKKITENKDLLDKEGNIDLEKAVEKIYAPLVKSLRTETKENNYADDVFTSV
jgi:integrase